MKKFIFIVFIGVFNMANASSRTIITIGGPIIVEWESPDGSENKEVTDVKIIKSFGGATYTETENGKTAPVQPSVYLQDGDDTKHLYNLGVRGGTINYVFKEALNRLWLVYEYNSPRELNDGELQDLYNFTQGQWYDGSGPIFSGELSDINNGISPLSHPQEEYVYQNTPNK